MTLIEPLRVDLDGVTAGWMLFSLLIGGVVVLAALAAHDAQRAANRSVRWVWCSAIALIVGLSLSAPLRRLASPERIPHAAATVASANALEKTLPRRSGLGGLFMQVRDAVATPVNAAVQSVVSTLDAVPSTWQRRLASGWILASLLTLTAFGVSYARIRRTMRQWPTRRVDDVRARIAPHAGPAVIGLAPSEIVLPSWLLARPLGEQRLVVAHESEHVRAGDPWLLVFACGAIVCMPWHPALWFALGRLRLAIELDCDQRVLRRGVPRSAYGALLIDLSALRPSLPSAMPAFSCNGSFLERRLVAMTSRPTRFSSARRIAGAFIACAALITACESKLPTSAEVERMDVAGVVEEAKRISLVDSGGAVYIVDGTRVSPEAAKAIAVGRIASVEVVKGVGSELSEIRIATNDSSLARVMPDVEARRATELRSRLMRSRDTSEAGFVVVRDSPKRTFEGLLIVDGVVVESSALQRMSPESIGSVEVIKGAAAQRLYGERAAKGVIKVTTKRKE